MPTGLRKYTSRGLRRSARSRRRGVSSASPGDFQLRRLAISSRSSRRSQSSKTVSTTSSRLERSRKRSTPDSFGGYGDVGEKVWLTGVGPLEDAAHLSETERS